MPTATEAVNFSNIGATTAAFRLKGGKYAIAANATGTGTMGVQMTSLDGTTGIAVHTAFSATTGFVVVDLPPGSYTFVIATFTAVYASICRIPS
jgi:hypothetical protein